jgi:hypothetical protein
MLLVFILAGAKCVPSGTQRPPLVTKVEHFYLVSDDAERLYRFFRDEFQLPVVWAFNSYGDFASGGLTLGNVALEFVSEKGERRTAGTEFKGIALEPAGDADAAVAELKRRGILHGEPEADTLTENGQSRVGWITVDLKIPPAGAYIFLCDYKQRDEVAGRRRMASNELAARGGGPLGLTSVKEITIGVTSVDDASGKWRKLLDSEPKGVEAVFAFGGGPKVRLVRAETEGIQSIVVGVKSAQQARQFLNDRRMLGEGTQGQLVIRPAAIGGLKMMLVED